MTYDAEMSKFVSYIPVVQTGSLDALAGLVENDTVSEANWSS
jgi:hypothetical protein